MNYTITENNEYKSLEIKFDAKPDEKTRDALKALRFRWHGQRGIWYGYTDRATLENALNGSATPAANIKSAPAPLKTTHSAKVGDLFVCSWGYDQTNYDFFQIVELVGVSSARVREVRPDVITRDVIHSMAENCTYRLPDPGEMLPAERRSIFVKDQERGDIHRIKTDSGTPFFVIEGRYYCRPYSGGVCYETSYA